MNVLIADDDAVTRRSMEVLISSWGYDTVLASDGTEAWRLLQGKDRPRLAVLDWMMPGMDGAEICRRIRKLGDEPYVYILLLTIKDGKESFIEGFEAGVDDYVTKPFDAEELKARMRAGRRIVELHEQLVRSREDLRAEATHDSLTGLWNRSAIMEMLSKEVVRSTRKGIPVAVAMADLDHFKNINDTHGHLAGDAVLRAVAHRMSAATRTYDSVGRYGGEEFLIVTPECDAANAVKQAERLARRIRGAPVETPAGKLAVPACFGVAVTTTKVGVDSLLHAADTALYRAKHAGRDCVMLASEVSVPEG